MSVRDQKRKLRDHVFQSEQAERDLEMTLAQLLLQRFLSSIQSTLPPQRATPIADWVYKYKYRHHCCLLLVEPPHAYSHSLCVYLKEISLPLFSPVCGFILLLSFSLLLSSVFVFSFTMIFSCFSIVKTKRS